MTPQQRAEAIDAAVGDKLRALVREAARLADGRASPQAKGERIIDIAEAVSKAITPHTPCAGGTCSHCCYMATCVSGFEARMIGRYVGRTPRALGRESVASFALEDELRARFTGARCTFLTDAGRCGIYPVRPAACRLHHNLEDTADNCRIQSADELVREGERMSTPHMNLTTIQAALAFVFVHEDFGDIREFFPPE